MQPTLPPKRPVATQPGARPRACGVVIRPWGLGVWLSGGVVRATRFGRGGTGLARLDWAAAPDRCWKRPRTGLPQEVFPLCPDTILERGWPEGVCRGETRRGKPAPPPPPAALWNKRDDGFRNTARHRLGWRVWPTSVWKPIGRGRSGELRG